MTVHGPRITEALEVARFEAAQSKEKRGQVGRRPSDPIRLHTNGGPPSANNQAPIVELPKFAKPINLNQAPQDRPPELKLLSFADASDQRADLLEQLKKNSRAA